MKIMTILGTRPEIIRLSLVIKLLDQYANHILVHTGQNYDDRLNGLFFRELGIREPDAFLGVRGDGFADQVGQILAKSEPLFMEHRPDRLLILGDTNSGLTALVARRLGIPVYHMEAGNRCYDDRLPEEVNRRVIDHSSSVLMPYTQRSRENLLREGFEGHRIFVIGNPINEVMQCYSGQIAASAALAHYGLERRSFFLVTLHRAENVDVEERLRSLIEAFALLYKEHGFPVVCSLHPRTRSKIAAFHINLNQAGLRFVEPLGFFDFVRLEQEAFCLLSDSGTVQEEACILGVPNVTIREVTERPETIECGSNVLTGCDPERIVKLVSFVTQERHSWQPPTEYLATNVATKVCRVVLGFRIPDLAEQAWFARPGKMLPEPLDRSEAVSQ
ncbi:MAG: UDP-N-acetylglucosamine 2-epimerase (non-hydrolyzing) [Acidobacteria bacterium]|nr:UDP-N-acetylglucosamine 2-epimerase (non-hydrolyzing) [Acidobacteriota bacterium]MCI0719213.1 UDP-N-acetylglucosamine 2-epimerase (non-hydrolyzing) [Acidobacteriota bacterium]